MTHEEQMLFDAFASYAVDDLFWSLTYLSNAFFDTPLAEGARQKLLSLYQSYQALLTSIYPPEQCGGLAGAMEKDNQLFVAYIQALTRGDSQSGILRQRWRDNGQRMAALLAEANPYWKAAEWSAMIGHEADLLDTIATSMQSQNYTAFINTAPVCRRLAFDMSDYLYAGVEKQRSARVDTQGR